MAWAPLQIQSFKDKASREIEAQLAAVRDEAEFGVHTLLLADCLIYLNPDVAESQLLEILSRRGVDPDELDAFGVLTFLRRFSEGAKISPLKTRLLKRARTLVDLGASDSKFNAARVILRMSLAAMPGLSETEVKEATHLSGRKVKALMKSKLQPSLFAWNASDDYHQRLQLKIAQMVY